MYVDDPLSVFPDGREVTQSARTLDLPRFPDLPEKAPFLPVREERGNVQGN
mgnify:CR=1